jgi:aspartyl protease family protein
MRAVAAAALALLALGVQAQQKISFNGQMGERALLVIDGQPRVLGVGASSDGVRLLAVSPTQAQIEVQGQRRALALTGGSAGGGAAPAGGSEIVLAAGLGGHFTAPGRINGRQVQFMVDTGASVVTLSESVATRIGLDYQRGQRIEARTANGSVFGHLVTLDTLRVGDVEVANVSAAVLPASMEHVLLGNSFLSRFQMRRDNEILRLVRR